MSNRLYSRQRNLWCPGCFRLVHRCNCEQRVLRRWLLLYALLIVIVALIKVLGSHQP